MGRLAGIQGDNCGCAMGARFMAAALFVSVAWYAWHWHTRGLSLGAVSVRIAGFTFCAALVGKIVGIIAFRHRSTAAQLTSG